MAENFKLPDTARELDGETIGFANLHALEEYETALTNHLLPEELIGRSSGKDVWEGRKQLSDVLRPQKFYGQVGPLAVHFMVDPLRDFFDFRPGYRKKYIDTEWYNEHMIGMQVFAALSSTGRGTFGSMQSRLWVYPRHASQVSYISHSGTYHRIVEKPKQRNEKVEELLAASCGVADKVIRASLKHPLRGGFETKR